MKVLWRFWRDISQPCPISFPNSPFFDERALTPLKSSYDHELKKSIHGAQSQILIIKRTKENVVYQKSVKIDQETVLNRLKIESHQVDKVKQTH
jgi:hypothetical protein